MSTLPVYYLFQGNATKLGETQRETPLLLQVGLRSYETNRKKGLTSLYEYIRDYQLGLLVILVGILRKSC